MNNVNDFVIENGVMKKYKGTDSVVVIPDSVTSIGEGAMCRKIREITIPSSVNLYEEFSMAVDEPYLLVKSSLANVKEMDIDTFLFYDETMRYVIFETDLDDGQKMSLVFCLYTYGSVKSDNDIFEAFTANKLKIESYDKTRASLKGDALALTAITRLAYPYQLNERYSEFYTETLMKKIKKAAEWACYFDKPDWLKVVCDVCGGNKKHQQTLSEIISASEAGKCKEFLSSYTFSGVKATPAAKKKTKKKPEAIDHPTENFCKENYSEKEIMDIIKKSEGNLKDLSKVKYKDSTLCASEFAVACVVASYMRQMKERPKQIGRYKTDFISVEIDEKADSIAASFDEESFRKAIVSFCDLDYAYRKPQRLLPYCRFVDSAGISDVIKKINLWAKWDDFSSSGRSAIIVLRGALMLSDTREAMMFAEKQSVLHHYAGVRKTDAELIRISLLYDFGFDADGKKSYDLGTTTIEVSLNDALSLKLFDTATNKVVKSIPKKGTDASLFEAADADYKDLKKNIKALIKTKIKNLFYDFLSGDGLNTDIWEKMYLENPVLRQLGSLLVWEQNGGTFTIKDKKIIKADGSDFTFTVSGKATKDKVSLAHPMEMESADVSAWQKYFLANALKQPFEQIWEPVLDGRYIKEDRYKGCMIPYYRFVNQEKRGITVNKNLATDTVDIGLSGFVSNIRRIDWHRHEIKMDDRFEIESISFRRYRRRENHLIAYFDRLTVYEKIKDDNAAFLADKLDSFTLAQICDFINVAAENNYTNITALLLEYKNKHFPDFDVMEEFVLD